MQEGGADLMAVVMVSLRGQSCINADEYSGLGTMAEEMFFLVGSGLQRS